MFFTSFLLLQAPLNVKNTKPLLTQKHLEQRKSQILTRSATYDRRGTKLGVVQAAFGLRQFLQKGENKSETTIQQEIIMFHN